MRSAAGEVVGVVTVLTDVSERHERERMIREAALLDPLTALPNRTLLSERISHASARARRHPESRFAVLFLDVDHLKWVNDSFGHAAGDELLTAVAGRLRACVRPEDTLARIGGDEFAVLLEGIEDSTDATRVCERILGELAKPIQVADLEMSTSASIGIVVESSSNRGPDELLRDADAAMYRAKALGGGRCEIFDRELQRLVSSRLTAEQELRRAVERDELVLHYQPIVALGTRQVVGLEALLRWQHPERGLLLPAEFISIAEGTNLILPIGRWVLSTACGQLHDWRARYFDRAPRWVAVNLSSKQFLQPGLLAQVKQALREASLRPDELRLEITESTVSQNSGVATGILTELTALGIRVNMDDFGTGYSSLGSLYHLPIEALKIDRSFVSDLRPEHGSDHLVRTIVSVAQGVGASTIAEGISTNEQLGELRRLGCQYGQGYLFSRPLTVEEVEPLLRANPGAGVL
jgi:diguanylate cyclase (GGDEF)-like protein